jgi:hypothetical protein
VVRHDGRGRLCIATLYGPEKRLALLARLSALCRAVWTIRRSVCRSWVKSRVSQLPIESDERRATIRPTHTANGSVLLAVFTAAMVPTSFVVIALALD